MKEERLKEALKKQKANFGKSQSYFEHFRHGIWVRELV